MRYQIRILMTISIGGCCEVGRLTCRPVDQLTSWPVDQLTIICRPHWALHWDCRGLLAEGLLSRVCLGTSSHGQVCCNLFGSVDHKSDKDRAFHLQREEVKERALCLQNIITVTESTRVTELRGVLSWYSIIRKVCRKICKEHYQYECACACSTWICRTRFSHKWDIPSSPWDFPFLPSEVSECNNTSASAPETKQQDDCAVLGSVSDSH